MLKHTIKNLFLPLVLAVLTALLPVASLAAADAQNDALPAGGALTETENLTGNGEALPEPEELYGADWYLVDKDFTWTYVHTHEADCGPYFCQAAPRQ